jgi:hypothetical protein
MANTNVSRKKPAKSKGTEDRAEKDFLKFGREFAARFKKMEESFASFKGMMDDFSRNFGAKPARKSAAKAKGRK